MNSHRARKPRAITLAAGACATLSIASPSEQLYQKHVCAACHVVDRKNVGLSLSEIAKMSGRPAAT